MYEIYLKCHLKSVLIFASIVILSMIAGCIPSDLEPKSYETLPPEKVKEKTVKISNSNKLEGEHEFLTFESNYDITSEFGDFGEEVTFLSDKVNDDLIVAKGSYASGVLFYRIYNLSFDKKQIVYEVTNERIKEYEKFESGENTFTYKNEKPTTLLEMPYEVGHSWEDGSITAIYEIEGEYFIEVTYKNHNKIIFSNLIGVKEIHYTLPPELQEIYKGITEAVIVAK